MAAITQLGSPRLSAHTPVTRLGYPRPGDCGASPSSGPEAQRPSRLETQRATAHRRRARPEVGYGSRDTPTTPLELQNSGHGDPPNLGHGDPARDSGFPPQ